MSDTPESHRDFRPDYWDPADPLTALIQNVKGAKRREMIEDIVTGRAREMAKQTGSDELTQAMLSEVSPGLLQDELEDPGQLSGIHPHFMGGEYLPSYDSGEVEIARITLESVTMDVIAIRARRADGRIHYRVVDEYETEFALESAKSKEPLTFGELLQLIDSIRTEDTRPDQSYVDWIRDSNVEGGADPDAMRRFITVSSPFYPALESYYEGRAEAWYEQEMRPFWEEEARAEQEALERERLRQEKKAREAPLIAPFRQDIERIVAKYEPEQSGAVGISIRDAHRYALEKFLVTYVVEHGELPCGRHQLAASVRCRFGCRPQKFDVDLDTLDSAGRQGDRVR